MQQRKIKLHLQTQMYNVKQIKLLRPDKYENQNGRFVYTLSVKHGNYHTIPTWH